MLNALVSYAYIKKSRSFMNTVMRTQGHVRWMLDSGAFTAHYQGEEICLDEYSAFLSSTSHLWWRYIALDKLGDKKQTKENLRVMRKRGLDPMPVLTVDSHLDETLELVGEHDSLCVAGAHMPIDFYGQRAAQVRRVVGDKIWLHGLGFTPGLTSARATLNSVDSSSWCAGVRYGRLGWYDPAHGVKLRMWTKLRAAPWSRLPPLAQQAIVGMQLENLSDPEITSGGTNAVGCQTTRAYLQMAAELERRGTTLIFATVPGTWPLFVTSALVADRHGVPWPEARKFRKSRKTFDFSSLAPMASAQVKKEWGIE